MIEEKKKNHRDIFTNIIICYLFISLWFDHKFSGVPKQGWDEFIRIHKFANPFLSLASIVGLIAFIISYFAFYKVFRTDETCNPGKLARLARFYYYALLYNICCGAIKFVLGTTTFFAYENYTLIDIVWSQSLHALIWITLMLSLLGSGRKYIKAALAE